MKAIKTFIFLIINICCQHHIVEAQRFDYVGFIHSKIDMSVIGKGSQNILSSKSILYKEFLIEPVFIREYEDGVFKGNKIKNYNFIDLKNKKYIKYDTLSTRAKILEKGNVKYQDEEAYLFSADHFKNATEIQLKDTVVENKKIKIASGIEKKNGGDILTSCRISSNPRNFPLQWSDSVSKMAGGGLTYEVEHYDLKSNIVVHAEFNYEATKLPEDIVRIIKSWGAKIKSL